MVRMSEEPRRPSPGAPESTGLGRHLDVFFEDPALWPLVIIFAVHAVLAGALVLLWALRSGNPAGGAALAALALLSVREVLRARRRRRAIWIAVLWALSALTAGASSYLGLL